MDPGLKPESSVLDSVGASIETPLKSHKDRPKVRHDSPMLSLDNLHTPEDLRKFLKKVGNTALHVEAKTDGLSVSLLYADGKLVRAATRGDGTIGEDVTENARTLASIPQEISFRKSLEVRGEVYIDRDDLDIMNTNPEKCRTYANPRNAAAGSLRLKDPAETARRPLKFHFHGHAGKVSRRQQTQGGDHKIYREPGTENSRSSTRIRQGTTWASSYSTTARAEGTPAELSGTTPP